MIIGLHVIDLTVCGCSPAAQQLVSQGLFPCAPLAPSLAVDITLLQFTQALFVRLPPNTTLFCDTLEYFLEARGYKLTTRVSAILFDECMLTTAFLTKDTLRWRFGNALLWYSSLTNVLKQHVQGCLEASRRALRLLATAGMSNGRPSSGKGVYT